MPLAQPRLIRLAMTTLLRCLILFLVSLSVEAGAPAISCTPNRTTGTAPLGVILDCTGTTDGDTAKPFHDLYYTHTFGDLSAGAWTYGANTALSKNFATGPIAAHVYETAGTYTITSTVSDGTTLARVTNTITVTAADTTFPTTATVCFTNGSDFTGCPAGATQTGSVSDWDVTLGSCVGTTKRCLFRRGDTFTASATTNVGVAGPGLIGAYGSGAKPIVNVAATRIGVALNNDAVSDWRIMDLEFVGTGANDAGGTEACVALSAASVTRLTVLRVVCRDMGANNFLFAAGSSPNWRSITESVIQESESYNNFGGSGIFARMFSSAILGNLIGPVAASGGEFPLRVQRQQKSVIAYNTIKDAPATKEVVSMRADLHSTTAEDSFYSIFADNKVMGGTRVNAMVRYVPNAADDRIYDMIAERNWILMEAYTGATTCKGITVAGVRMTIRNNLIDMSAPTVCIRHGVETALVGTEPVPDDVNVYNNTMYAAGTFTIRGTEITASATNTIVKNNLCWFDNGTTCVRDSGSGSTVFTQPTAGGNSSDAQTTGTDPSFDTPLTSPIGFRIGTGSYASNVGVAIWPASNDDFFHCDDTTANERIGAFVPRVRATCRGSAGP